MSSNGLPIIAAWVFAVLCCSSNHAHANPPDLTAGGVPNNTRTTNLGPTGARGWVYHTSADSSLSRQIQITAVAAGSPASGILAANDVILGAGGTGAEPAEFTYDARRALADAINDAEARSPATLRLLRWRSGTTTTVTLTLQTMGAYSATAPYNCAKSALILQQGLQAIMAGETAGRYSFGTLGLLAANNPADPDNAARMTRARNEARALIPSAAVMQQMMADERDATSMVTWQRGHTLVVLAEYYLLTGDTLVLPAIEAYAVNIARNSSLFGTMGHIFATKNPDGSDNGPMGGVYGPVNSSGITCFLGLLLARECGITHWSLDPAIARMSLFYAYYAGRGAIPYGEHEAYWQRHESNGKSGLAAICFHLLENRAEEAKFNAKMATAAASERELGHTGAFFNYLWSPLGAAAGGEEAAAAHFQGIRWMLDLNRRWDGKFEYDCLNGEGPNSGATYNDFRMSTAALLTYALPLRQLRVTGKNHDPSRWLTAADVTAATAVDGYNPVARTINELIADLGNWSPMVQRRAAEQLATRSIDTTTLNQLIALANDPVGTSRTGACLTLGRISNSATANTRAATLAALLTDPQNPVRFMAAEAMRYLPDSARLSQLNAILTATATTAKPLFPFDEEDPLHFAHGRLAMLLFYSGSAYGPRGVIWGSRINSPTVATTLRNPDGTLPPNSPPVADSQTVNAIPGNDTPILLTATDPEGYPLVFRITSQPTHGTLAGTPPNIIYRSSISHLGADSFTFQAMDSEGQTSSATISINVSTANARLAIHEPFDYAPGGLNGKGGTTDTGFATNWQAATTAQVVAGSLAYGTLTTSGGSIGNLNGGSNNFGGTRTITTTSLAGNGLLADGATLWFSVVMGYGTNFAVDPPAPANLTNARLAFALANSGFSTSNNQYFILNEGSQLGSGLGVTLGRFDGINGKVVATQFRDSTAGTSGTAGNIFGSVPASTIGANQHRLVVGKITWGAASDTIELYEPDANLNLNLPTSTLTVNVDQSKFDTLTWARGDTVTMDEIRFGDSLAAVVGLDLDPPDTIPPTLTSIVDDRGGETAQQGDLITYSLTFSEPINPATVGANDFGNAGTAAITIQSVTQPLPSVILVQLTPATTGTLQLRIQQGAVLTDLAGNPLDTTAPLLDDTIITVNSAMIETPFVIGLPQSEAQAALTAASLVTGTITSQYSASVPAGSVISQNPTGGTMLGFGSTVDLVISLGPISDKIHATLDIPVSGTVTNTATATHASDNVRQSIQEIQNPSTGAAGNRVSQLEHKWRYDLPAADTLTFAVEAHHTANSENDNFTFAYSTAGANGPWTNMLTVTKTADDNTTQTFQLPPGISGFVHVRVVDTDRTGGRRALDTIFIDHMYFQVGYNERLVPEIQSWPTATAIAEGQPLSAATLTGGSASVPGVFSFDFSAQILPPGRHAAAVTFTPENESTHQAVEGAIPVTVRTLFQAWAATAEETAGITFAGDANGDGVADGLAWLLGARSPAHNAADHMPSSHQQDGAFTLRFQLLAPGHRGSATLHLQHSPTLAPDSWTHVPIPASSGIVDGVAFAISAIPESNLHDVHATVPVDVGGSTFLRLIATAP